MAHILTLTAMSGVGKTETAKALLRRSRKFAMAGSVTDRPKRPSDIEGEYRYVSRADISSLKKNHHALWSRPIGEHMYATDYRDVLAAARHPTTVGILILVPDVMQLLDDFLAISGHQQRRTSVFLLPPEPDVFWERIRAGERSEAEIRERHKQEAWWEPYARESNLGYHFIKNDGTIDETAAQIEHLVP